MIGEAVGIIMGSYRLTLEEAFGVLSRLSQDGNTKLRDLAERLVFESAAGRPD